MLKVGSTIFARRLLASCVALAGLSIAELRSNAEGLFRQPSDATVPGYSAAPARSEPLPYDPLKECNIVSEWDRPIVPPRLFAELIDYQFNDYQFLSSELLRPPADKPAEKDKPDSKPAEKKEKKWYEKLSIRGYTQVRINGASEAEDSPAPPQYVSDGSVRNNQGFIIRRARIIISGDVHDNVSVYLQPDFASSIPGVTDAIEFAQIRDFYADIYLNTDKVNRIRVGQSKIPYGWEDLQSSSNRLPLDRNDAFNSGVKNERDIGVFYYWTPEYAQELYKYVLDENLKGSGNYGVLGLGIYNGQGGSLAEVNESLHFVARFNVPYQFSNGQIIEVGIQGYTGSYGVLSSSIFPLGVAPAMRPAGTVETGAIGMEDNRLGINFIYYPQPFGFQTEWTWGSGPELNAAQTAVETNDLHGGYAMLLYKYETDCRGTLFPFVRYQYYDGGYKSERNAPATHISECEAGLEWQFNKYLELTTCYVFTDRTNTTALSTAGTPSYEQFIGSIFRMQLQFSY